jgi:hypothetical protein
MSRYLKSIGALYVNDLGRREKHCEYCDIEFCDISQRNHRHTCNDECHKLLMVKKRHEKGSYTPTKEQRKARSIVATERARLHPISDKHRELLAISMKRRWAEGKINTENHWSKTPEGRKKISENGKGRKHTEAARHNMSLGQQKVLRTKRATMYTSARGGTREDLGQYFRSGWEANFARILNFRGTKWIYEHRTFQLTPTLSYTPDFYDIENDLYYELKGRFNEKSIRQLQLIKEVFPAIKLIVIDEAEYKKLRAEYKDKVNWEGK